MIYVGTRYYILNLLCVAQISYNLLIEILRHEGFIIPSEQGHRLRFFKSRPIWVFIFRFY